MSTYTCKKCGWSGEVNGRPRCLPCYREAAKKWRKENPDKHRESKNRRERRFRTERPDDYRAKRRRKYSAEHAAAKRAERIAWLAAGDVTRRDLIEVFEADGGMCRYCGAVVKPRFQPLDPRGFDHVIPRSKDGRHTKANLATCCRTCNERKADN